MVTGPKYRQRHAARIEDMKICSRLGVFSLLLVLLSSFPCLMLFSP